MFLRMTPARSITAILPTLNRPDYFRECLESLRKQTLPPAHYVVVDQSDDDRTAQVFKEFDAGGSTKVYHFQKTKSLTLARNQGLEKTPRADYVCFLDDDSVLFPDYFEKLVKCFEDHPEKNYAAGMGTVDQALFSADWISVIFGLPHSGTGRFLKNGQPTFPYCNKEFQDVEFISGGNSLFRWDVVQEYRYDERLTAYGHGDDVDISYRVSRSHRAFFEPQAIYLHDQASPGRDPGRVHRGNQIQNFYYLTRKNIGWSPLVALRFWWMVLGFLIQDLHHRRRSAFLGGLAAIKNIFLRKLPSISGGWL